MCGIRWCVLACNVGFKVLFVIASTLTEQQYQQAIVGDKHSGQAFTTMERLRRKESQQRSKTMSPKMLGLKRSPQGNALGLQQKKWSD